MTHITPVSAPLYFALGHGQVEMRRGKILALKRSRSKSSPLVNPSTFFFLSWFCFSPLEDDIEAELFLPPSLLAAFGFSYQGFLFYFSLHFFFFFPPFPTANRVVGEYKISQFRQRPNIPREQERKRERHDQPLPNRLARSRLHRAFLPLSENHMKQMRIMGNVNSQDSQGLATSDPPACSVALLCPCSAAVPSIYIPGSLLPAAAFPKHLQTKGPFFIFSV